MEEKRSSLPEKDGKKRRRRGGGIAVEEKKTDTSLRIEIVKEEGERERDKQKKNNRPPSQPIKEFWKFR